jgi:hypothetical protein
MGGNRRVRTFLGEQDHAFTPETVEVLVGAFDDAWKVVEASEGIDRHRDAWRLILAKQIMLVAAEGETDRERLSALALERFARAHT